MASISSSTISSRVDIYDGELAYRNTIVSGGDLYVSSGGTANSTTVNSGGWLYVSSGGTANENTVNSDGDLYVFSEGTANSTTVNSGGTLDVLSGGTANSTTVNSDGTLDVTSGGTANSTTVNSGGNLFVNGGTALQIKENGGFVADGYYYYYNDDDEVVEVKPHVTFVPNSFSGLVLSDGRTATVHSGTTAIKTTVNGGGLDVYSGGTANSTTVGIKKGYLFVYSGGTANDNTINASGRLYVESGGTANKTTVNSGGRMTVRSGTANSATVNSGGRLEVSSGGTATGFTVSNGGKLQITVAPDTYIQGKFAGSAVLIDKSFVSGLAIKSGLTMGIASGGTANSVTVNSNGKLEIASGGTATGFTVSNGGRLRITVAPDTYVQGKSAGTSVLMKNAYLSGFTINYDHDIEVLSGGTAEAIIVNSGGSLYVESGAAALKVKENGGYVGDWGYYYYYDDEVVEVKPHVTFVPNSFSGLVLNDADATVHSGTTATKTTVNSKGNLMVYSGGTANSTTVNSGGLLNVSSVGTANSTTVKSGGKLYIYDGGIHRGSLTIEDYDYDYNYDYDDYYYSLPNVYVGEGGTVDFTVSNHKADGTALINDLSLIYGETDDFYTITVSATQAAGTYVLAKGAQDFEGSISIGTETANYGSITVNGDPLQHGSTSYSLIRKNETLSLKIENSASPEPPSSVISGEVNVYAGETLSGVTVIDGGMIYVHSGGKVIDPVIDSGGWIWVSSGGTANSATVNRGGYLDIKSGTALKVKENGGSVKFGNTANVTFVPNSIKGLVLIEDTATVHSGTTATDIRVEQNGLLKVSSGGTATGIAVSEGGRLLIEVAPNTYIQGTSGGSAFQMKNACISGYTLNSAGIMEVISGGTANATKLNFGWMDVSSGGTASNTVINDGEMRFYGGIHRGTLFIADGADVSFYDGGTVDFTVSNHKADGTALINNLSLIYGDSDDFYTITVSATQAAGTYVLAHGAEDFEGSISIGTDTAKYGSLTVNGDPLQRSSTSYSLILEDETLSLKIDNSDTPPQPDAPENLSVTVKNYDATVTWDKVTAPKGVKVSYEVRVDGNNTFKATGNKYTFKKADVGEHTFEVRAVFTDKTGSETSEWSSEEAVEVKDVTAPKVANLTAEQHDDMLCLDWTASDNVGIDHFIVTCSGKDPLTIPGMYNYADFFGLTPGKVTVTVTAYDEAGLSSKPVKKTITLKDMTSPDQVTGLHSDGVDNKSGGVLTWNSATDNVGVTQYLISVEDENGKKTSYTSKTNSVKVKKMPAGEYKFTVIAVDKAKNRSKVSEDCWFEVEDAIAPKVSKLTAKVTNDSALVTWKATDETCLESLELSLDGGDVEDVTELGSYTFSGLSAGDHKLRLIAYDESGNTASKEVSFKVKEQKTNLPAGAVALDTASAVSPESDYEGEYYGEISAGESRLFRFSTEVPSMLSLYRSYESGAGTVTVYREAGTGSGVKIGSTKFSDSAKELLILPLDQTGTYYISGTAGRNDDVMMHWNFASADFENNSLETATVLEIADYYERDKYLCEADPVDWYKFTVDEPGTYEYGACRVRYGKVTQTLYDADGNKIVSKNIINDSKDRDSRYFAAGDYYLKCEYAGKSTDYTVYAAQNW